MNHYQLNYVAELLI